MSERRAEERATAWLNAALDAYGRTCEQRVSEGGDRCKEPAVDVEWRSGQWWPLCERHRSPAALTTPDRADLREQTDAE